MHFVDGKNAMQLLHLIEKFTKHPLLIIFYIHETKHHGQVNSNKKIYRSKTTPDASNPSTAVSAILASLPSCSHQAATGNDTNNSNDAISRDPKSTKILKSSTAHPREPDSVGTSLRIATQCSLQESILEMPKIPRKKGKAGGGGGNANVNLGDEDSAGDDVGQGRDRSRKGAATRGRVRGK